LNIVVILLLRHERDTAGGNHREPIVRPAAASAAWGTLL